MKNYTDGDNSEQANNASLTIKEILAQTAILRKQLSETIKPMVSNAILVQLQKQQRPGGTLAKTTPPTDTQTE
ncbi:MAG: hypothetical protein ACK53Q_06305 [Dolichospermum sp.]